jgi:hypothetical protein
VSGISSPEQAADRQAGAPIAAEARAARRRGRRRVAAGMVVVVAAAGAVAAGVSGVFGTPGPPGAAAGSSDKTSTAVVERRSLSSQTQVAATLGFAGSYNVAGQGSGTITWLPAAGRVIRQGGVLYRTGNASPVFLLYGRVPAWRVLSLGVHGADVRQLNTDMVKLGYVTSAELGPRAGWKYFTAVTAAGLEGLQARLGLTVTGSLPLGQAVFLPAAIRVTKADVSLVSAASGTVLSATSARRVVTIALNADQQTEVKAGDKVSITLPDGSITPGRVSSVGKVASGSGSSATVTVQVALRHPKAAKGLDQAPVTVAITTGSVTNALVVPVNALLARAGGGYAVEVTGPGGHHLVPVTPGVFDDAAGLVQVTGTRLAAGQRVVVPGL